jgi:hypothetical protein
MIILSILLIALLLLASTVIVRYVFNPKWVWLNKVIIATLVITCAFTILSGFMSAACQGQIDNLEDEAQTIILYYNTINESDNEYVRFDFYQRVKDYNARYADLQDNTASAWIGAFYPKGWDSEIGLIDFMLRTGSENGAYDYEDFFGNEAPGGNAAG